MSEFTTPKVHINEEGWGPESSNLPPQFKDVPFAPFGKGDRIGRAADFTVPMYYQNRQYNRGRRGEEAPVNDLFQYKYDKEEDTQFELVDTTKTQRRGFGIKNRWHNNQRGRGGRWNQSLMNGGSGPLQGRDRNPGTQLRAVGRGNREPHQRRSKLDAGRRQWRRHNRTDRQASVEVQGDWKVVEEFDLPQLVKLQANAPAASDLLWCGALDKFNASYDKITTRTQKRLQRCENKEFYYVTTTDDPVIEKLAVEGAGNVFATDAIIALLMSAPRSVLPWDIVVQKMNDSVFFDKRDNSRFDYLTVNETAFDPPTASGDDPESINNPDRLSFEATMINQNFSQQILTSGGRESFEPNPFFDEDEARAGETPATIAYRYRNFKFSDELNMVIRCELHGTTEKRGKKEYMTAYALNEWDSKLSGGTEWRQKIDQQRGAVLATELKNNSCKLARWTAQSVIAGADQMKLGFVSRVAKTNAYEHTVLGCQSFKPVEFAGQITMKVNNMWGIVKMLVELFQKQEDGKFVMMKDPNKSVVRVYSVPPNTFESDEESESDEEEEEED
ncbi:unnamed protein product [Chrysoparadoxa australica]